MQDRPPATRHGVIVLDSDGKRTRIGTQARLPVYTGNVHWPESPHACVWPMWGHDGEVREKHFCGRVAMIGRPYCKTHWRRSRSRSGAGGEPQGL